MQDKTIAENTRKQKIGIMGGTFDPIHIGHLILGEVACEQLGLDKVFYMPSGNPPHKQDNTITPDINRCAMVDLAIFDNDRFTLSLLEVNRGGFTYTADTLRELNEKHPDCEFYFIVGGDSLISLEKWREPDVVLKLCTLVAAVRDEVDCNAVDKQIEYLNEKYNCDIIKLKTPNIEISSSLIRELVKDHKSVKYYVPSLVEEYIKKHKLYID
ncbi:MAG: nicotinate-nucleotide adenylyltransferase [bacterium]|nr:nicotinate-nucleotide adenylyltransferase [bacterium]